MQQLFLLGSQRPTVNLDAPFNTLASAQPVAVISAGWQDAEGDIDDVREIVQRELIDLRLYQRAEEIFTGDSRLREYYRKRQDRLQQLQRIHRLRLRQAMLAARRVLRAEGDRQILQHERRHAISQLRALDRHHLKSIVAIHDEFERSIDSNPSLLLAQHTEEVATTLAACDTVIITGGNVAVLLNRLRLFGFAKLLTDKHIVAWSAGAMALTDRVILFHDNTPFDTRDAEIFGTGLGILHDLVLLPDARHRLRQNDKLRVGLFSRRFAPDLCVTLDSGSLLHYADGRLVLSNDCRRLLRSGGMRRLRTR